MQITALHPAFKLPIKGSDQAGAFDIFMPTQGTVIGTTQVFGLGFAAAVPVGHVALILPRSSVGARYGLELNNTCGVIDSDYRGEWKASLRTKTGLAYTWSEGDRILQFLIVPVAPVTLEKVACLDTTARGIGGFGSSGQ